MPKSTESEEFKKKVMKLHHQGLDTLEISEKLNRPRGTVKTIIHEAKSRESGDSKFTDVFAIMNNQVRGISPTPHCHDLIDEQCMECEECCVFCDVCVIWYPIGEECEFH